MKLPTDPDLGPVLSGAIWLLLLSISFLVATLPFSAVLNASPGVIAGVISALIGVLGIAIQARGKVGRNGNGKTSTKDTDQ